MKRLLNRTICIFMAALMLVFGETVSAEAAIISNRLKATITVTDALPVINEAQANLLTFTDDASKYTSQSIEGSNILIDLSENSLSGIRYLKLKASRSSTLNLTLPGENGTVQWTVGTTLSTFDLSDFSCADKDLGISIIKLMEMASEDDDGDNSNLTVTGRLIDRANPSHVYDIRLVFELPVIAISWGENDQIQNVSYKDGAMIIPDLPSGSETTIKVQVRSSEDLEGVQFVIADPETGTRYGVTEEMTITEGEPYTIEIPLTLTSKGSYILEVYAIQE